MRSVRISAGIAVLLGLAVAPALANDSTAALGAGGINLVRNEQIDILSEDLYVSPDQIKVTYHFRNHTDAPVTYIVAFPLPLVDATIPEETEFVLPDTENDNFVDFAVSVDGQKIEPSMAQRALALDIDRTEVLKQHGLPLNPAGEGLYEKIEKLSPEDKQELNRLGLLLIDPYNTFASWKLETTFYWEQTFPPGKEVVVEHTYKPVVGYSFFGKENLDIPESAATYCIDGDFKKTAGARLDQIANSPNPYFDEKRISYILTTARNWATAIQSFRLVVDKGSPDALVSFCGTNVRKIGPTQFEMTATDFYPEHELEVLIVQPHKDQ